MDNLLSVLGGGVGVAIVSGIFLTVQNSMAQKSAERLTSKKLTEEKIDELIRKVDLVIASGLVVLHDRIKHLARSHIKAGSVTYDERQDLMKLYEIYHNKLDGNGNITSLIDEFKKVPIV